MTEPVYKEPRFIGDGASFGVGDEVWAMSYQLEYECKLTQTKYIVPQFFFHDFGSVPRIFQPIVPRIDGIADRAYELHDYLTRNRKLLGLTLLQCHAIFREALVCLRVPRWKVKAVYAAVYVGNWAVARPGTGGTPDDILERVRFELLPLELRPA